MKPQLLGVNLAPIKKTNLIFSSVVPPSAALEAVFSLRQFQSPVQNQFYGTCVGHTGKDVKEALDIRLTGTFTPVSAKGLYILCKDNDGYSGQGTTPQIMLSVATGIGMPSETDCPDTPSTDYQTYLTEITDVAVQKADLNRFAGYAQCITPDDIKAAVKLYGNVAITIPVYEDYLSTNQNGVVQQPLGQLVGYHEVSIIGWDESGQKSPGLLWEVKNHWGTSWGDAGYGFLPSIYAGVPVYYEAYSVVDFVDPGLMKGAPVHLAYPVATPNLTQGFGANPAFYAKYGLAGHEGLDFGCPSGTKVMACDAGTVLFAGTDGPYGKAVRIQHSWGISNYAHNGSFTVAVGQQVVKGQVIALSDNSGDSTGPHCHFGIKINGVSNPAYQNWVDPTPYLTKGDRMLVFFQVKGVSTIWALMDGAWVGFADMTAFNGYINGRQNVVIELDAAEFAKLQANPDVFKS